MRSILVPVVSAALVLVATASGRQAGGTPIALVTAEQQNKLFAIELPSGKKLRRATLPADPQNVAVGLKVAVVVSTKAHAATLLDRNTLRVLKVIRAFAVPHIVTIPHGGNIAYVTDDARGMMSTIDLDTKRVTDLLVVGIGAHHMAISPDDRRAWIALGEHARRIVIVNLANPRKPTPLRNFSPGFIVHDLTFSPDGRRVWVTSGTDDVVRVLDARTGKEVFDVRVGAAPQHVVFSDLEGSAFITSGNSDRIVKADPRRGRILATAATPHGSYNLSTEASLVVVSSLLDGSVTEFDTNMHRLMSTRVARAARGVALTVW
jgi:YVTN family beta-propeller protein